MQIHSHIKFSRLRNWSAPAIISAYISLCMIIIFSFESLGLTNREKNLEYRKLKPPEKIIKFFPDDFKRNSRKNIFKSDIIDFHEDMEMKDLNQNLDLNSHDLFTNKIIKSTKKTIETQNDLLFEILIDGAKEQMKIEIGLKELKGD